VMNCGEALLPSGLAFLSFISSPRDRHALRQRARQA